MSLRRIFFALCVFTAAPMALADSGGFLGIDHRLTLDEKGVWARGVQKTVEYGSALAVVGGALYEGSESRLGKTYWKALDAMLLADVSAQAAKLVFRRQRPFDGNNPNAFFNSSKDTSFPSGEMTHISAVVTPFIVEYQKDTPAVWLLAALPAYVGVARLKSQAHWQTDILAGGALGAGIGYLASQRNQPWTASVLPGGFSVGYKSKF
jgi:membrane-associated phospholipid phosphatase